MHFTLLYTVHGEVLCVTVYPSFTTSSYDQMRIANATAPSVQAMMTCKLEKKWPEGSASLAAAL